MASQTSNRVSTPAAHLLAMQACATVAELDAYLGTHVTGSLNDAFVNNPLLAPFRGDMAYWYRARRVALGGTDPVMVNNFPKNNYS